MAEGRGVFRCKRCAFASCLAAVEADAALVPCPLCGRRRSYVALSLRCLGWAVVLGCPLTLAAFMLAVAFRTALFMFRQRGEAWPFVVAVLIVAAGLVANIVWRWNKAIAAADAVKLRRFWEWQLPSGPRVVAVQDPAAGTDAVWIDAERGIPSDDGSYIIALHGDVAEGPYREPTLQATLRFPADGTCWLMLGGKRIDPLRTSPDVV